MGIPARAKPTGIYLNSALAKTEANLNGFDEAIVLSHEGHVSEGSGENIFIIQDGRLITPPSPDDILVGITRETVIRLAQEELGIETVERSIDRSELYIADEVLMTGTAAHVTPIIEIDHRKIRGGQVGPSLRTCCGYTSPPPAATWKSTASGRYRPMRPPARPPTSKPEASPRRGQAVS